MEDCLQPYGVRLSILARAFRREVDKKVDEVGLTGVQFFVLVQLHRLEDQGKNEIYQKDLEEAAHLTHPTMTEIIKLLEARQFITCSTSPRDRRCKVIASTEKCENALQQTKKVDEVVFRQLAAGLSAEDITRFLHCVDVMSHNAAAFAQPGSEKEGGVSQ